MHVLPFSASLLRALDATGPVWRHEEIVAGAIGLPVGLAVAAVVFRFVRRTPWPRPFRLRFLAWHVVAAPLAAATWGTVSLALQSLVLGTPLVPALLDDAPEFLVIGAYFYLVIAGISYAVDATARASRAETAAARAQLAALRAQLHPHFLFNALHTVVQLIPVEPARAAEAAELVGDLLRAALEEQRDVVPLADEWRFVSRYLALERVRFGDRLVVRADMPAALLDECVPAFALQTLVENAVRHGAAPRVAPTEIVVAATGSASELTLSVRNDGVADAARGAAAAAGAGTGLARLRERLAVLHGSASRLVARPTANGAFEAVLVVPRRRGGEP